MNKTKTAALFWSIAIIAPIIYFGFRSVPPVQPAAKSNAVEVRALPFTIEEVMLSDLFKDNLKVSKVVVRVNGGTKDEWIATALAIALKVGDLGADSIEATVDRNDLEGIDAPRRYRHLAKVYYSPNPKHSVWGADPTLIMATDRLASKEDIQIDSEFYIIYEKLINKGVNTDVADKKAGVIIAKKYHLPEDWRLFSGGLRDTKFTAADFNVNNSDARESLKVLDDCMRGKTIRMLITCR